MYVAVAALAGTAVGLSIAGAAPSAGPSPLLVAAVVAPALFAAETAAGLAWRRAARPVPPSSLGAADRAARELAESCLSLRSEEALAEAVRGLLVETIGHARADLYVARQGGAWERVGGARERVPLDDFGPTAEFLAQHREPIAARGLRKLRAGKARSPLKALMNELRAEMLIPLVDRDRLLGAIAVAGSPPLGNREALGLVEQAASRTLTYLGLLREAEARVGVAREGEVAAAARHVAEPGLREHVGASLSITSHYQPADSFGGDFFSAAELVDGRTFVAIGDVAGRGMPAALISAAVAGACEASERLLAPGASILEVVRHFNQLVGAVGRDRHAMSCFFALFESDARSVTFADAGHPFPYVCHPGDDGAANLRALVARGVPLGLEREPNVEVRTADLEEGDAIVLYTDAVVEAAAPGGGAPYGDRRLRRLLRRRAASPRLCQTIAGDVLDYCGDRPHHDDMTIAVVRVGASPRRRRISGPVSGPVQGSATERSTP